MAATQAVPVTDYNVAQQDTVHLKLQTKSSVHVTPHPPVMAKPKGKLRLDPQRALEPARKKLSTLESQRVMAVLVQSIRKVELMTVLPFVMENLDRYSVILGTDLVKQLEDHKVIIQSFKELKQTTEDFFEKEQQALRHEQNDSDQYSKHAEDERPSSRGSQTSKKSRASSAASIASQTDGSMRNLILVAKQMQRSCKNILRLFSNNPAAMNAVLKDHSRSEASTYMIGEMLELKEIIMGMLLTTPVEEQERNQYLKEVSERERYNANIITKLETELKAALDDKDSEIKKKNDVIRHLQADLHQIEKFSDEHIRRTKSEAEKQEAADTKNSEGKRTKLQQELTQLKSQLQSMVAEHREEEQSLRKRKFKIETEVENWIQKYDQDMGERQTEYEAIDADYTEEKKQLNELEERFKTLETEYDAIMEERRIARERRDAAERELQMAVRAATTIQAFWRSFKVRKALKGKKKKKGGGKKKGKK